MNEDYQVFSFLDSTPDSVLYDYTLAFDKIKTYLSKFGLTPNESKVFIYLGKYGSKAAIEISKTLKIARTETYRVLNAVQNRGIVSATFEHPTRFSCLSIDNAIDVLIETEMENVKTLETQKDTMVDLWQSIPMFSKEDSLSDEKFQMVKGQNSIMRKINEMFSDARKSLLLFGPERFFLKLFHSDSLDLLSDCKSNIRILTSCSQKSMHIFKGLKAEIKKTPPMVQNDLCFVVEDNKELLSFVKSDFTLAQEILAIRTDCTSLIYTMTLLFNQIWSGAHGNIGNPIKDNSCRHLSENIPFVS